MNISKTAILSTGLFISLAINILLGNIMLGKHAAGQQMDKRVAQASLKFVKELPPAQRQKVEQIAKSKQSELADKRRELLKEQKNIRELLRAKQFDKAQLESAFTRYRNASSEMQAIIQSIMLESAALLSPKDRPKLLEQPRK